MYSTMFKFTSYIFILLLLLSCSTDQKDKEIPISITNISIKKSENKTPKESEFQINLDLEGIVSEENLKQTDIQYKWGIEYIEMDINNADSKKDISTDILYSHFKEDYYFLDVSKNSLTSLLSVYKPGYYKISLYGSNINETKVRSVIVKVGNPEPPELNLKLNIPKIKSEMSSKGSFFISYSNSKSKNKFEDIIEIKASDLSSDWYNTGIKINPFLSFNIIAGTHILDGENDVKTIKSITNFSNEKDTLFYDFQETKEKKVSLLPIVLNDIDSNTIFSIYKNDNIKWYTGNIYVSFLVWGYNEDARKDEFIFFENSINQENENISSYFNNKYLVKIFAGSYGLKVSNSDYFIYFGPEGINVDELDISKERDFSGLPYGYLLGKLGTDGKPFPIGASYSYINSTQFQIYSEDKFNNFVIQDESTINNKIDISKK
ncbi:MAG: hypothetical protein A2086_13985 [Spirochaetes bacterium GWD1_27_9]|nr:MAG: hypothetical protein A2Z98_14895 [Spirochaetes bacterium GWB1_27_13]OHD27998.1 MAG: hypothetical protein A2Y34_03065 [Spirochaetes bacterium GWC1_27_15]OHD38286.1 MAG: hypothetical protein A2086_13985 [Spirochaetes bacterium GWD1_27_9]